MNNTDEFDATQRVHLDAQGHPAPHPQGLGRPTPPRPTPSRRAAERRRRHRVILIALCIAAVVVLAGIIAIFSMVFGSSEEDDGLILNNVFAAGVNLGGMTPEQAKQTLHAQTDGTYEQLDMTISILDSTVVLSPAQTGAKLDVDAVVDAAYQYGRSGSRTEQQRIRAQASNSSYTVSILPYLNLDTDYIKNAIAALGSQYSTLLKQTTYSLEGTAPDLNMADKDTSIAYQTLTVKIGTAEYGLNTDDLYDQIMDAYEINIFHVTANCPMVAPDVLDYEAVYAYAGCVAPVNAEFDPDTYEVTDEIYGYGFTIDELQAAVEAASYGDTVTVELHFIEPDILKEFYNEIFQDTLASFATELPEDENWVTNLKLAAQLLNGTIIKADETFSFNDLIGKPTTKRGFKSAGEYLGRSYQEFVGAGLSQAASTLYYCALAADLDIVEHNSHSYVTSYIQAGFDAAVYYGTMDLQFVNDTGNAIRIDCSVSGNELRISIMGTDSRDYTVELSYKVTETYRPQTVLNTMLEGNAGGYTEGTVLSEGIEGCTVETYVVRYSKDTGRKLTEVKIAETYYAKRDRVVVTIYQPPVVEPDPGPTDPTDPTDPSDPTDPTEPSDPTIPTDPTDPTEPEPTEPDNGTQGSSESTENTEGNT